MQSTRLTSRVVPRLSQVRSFAQSSAPASRPGVNPNAGAPFTAAPSSTPNISNNHGIPITAFQSRINTPEQDLAIYRSQQRRNAGLGLVVAVFVGCVWTYSAWMVSGAKETFTTPEFHKIQAELDREDQIDAKQKAK